MTDWENYAWQPEHEIRFGFNLADIDRMARVSVTRARAQGGSYLDRVNAAISAIAEALCVAESPPDYQDLVHAGWAAVAAHVAREMRERGKPTDATMTGAQFEVFWWSTAGVTPSHESRIVDRASVWQIWPTLTRRMQQALASLAATENQDLAAELMGVTPSNFRVLLSMARRRFLVAWHEGEAPSGLWQDDRRLFRRDGLDRYGRPRITASQLDAIRERRHSGETLSAIGLDYGVKKACLSSLLSGRTRPAPDPVGAA